MYLSLMFIIFKHKFYIKSILCVCCALYWCDCLHYFFLYKKNVLPNHIIGGYKEYPKMIVYSRTYDPTSCLKTKLFCFKKIFYTFLKKKKKNLNFINDQSTLTSNKRISFTSKNQVFKNINMRKISSIYIQLSTLCSWSIFNFKNMGCLFYPN